MRVVINGMVTLLPKTGIGHYVSELSSAMARVAPEHTVTMYPSEFVRDWSASWNARKRHTKKSPAKSDSLVNRCKSWVKRGCNASVKMAMQIHFTSYSRMFPFDIYHEPNFMPMSSALPTVVTVHDLSVLKFPQWHPSYRVANHGRHFLHGLDRAHHIIVDSEAVRRELIDDLGCPSHRVTTVHLGIGPQYRPQTDETLAAIRTKYNLPDRFFLCVGTIEPRKNLSTVMKAFIDLPPEVRSQCPLVLAGPWGWKSEEEREIFDTSGAHAGIRHLGYIPADDLPGLYSLARVLLYPSHYEGFGLPPLEMLACGGAVITSTDPAVREVLGRTGMSIEAIDLDAWRQAMKRVATDDDYLKQLKYGGIAHASKFTWDQTALNTFDVYRGVLGLHSNQKCSADASSNGRCAA